MDFLLSMDTMWIAAFALGGFILYELRLGEVPVRWFGSIRRNHRPVFYWLSILFHLMILGIVIYAWVDGLRIPLSSFFN
jgi:ABC-type spermidine/putrescine transport system permease subunit II